MFRLNITMMIQPSSYENGDDDSPPVLREVLEIDRLALELKQYTQADIKIVEDVGYLDSSPKKDELILFYGDPFPDMVNSSPLEWQKNAARHIVIMNAGFHYDQRLVNQFGFAAIVDFFLYSQWLDPAGGFARDRICELCGLKTVLTEIELEEFISEHLIGVYGSVICWEGELPMMLACYLEAYLNVELSIDQSPDLVQVLKIDDPKTVGRKAVVKKLGRLNHLQAIEVLLDFLRDEDPYIRVATVYSLLMRLRKYGDEFDVRSTLQPIILEDPFGFTREVAIGILCKYANQKNEDIRELLYQVIEQDAEVAVRERAVDELVSHVKALGLDARNALQKVLEIEKDVSIREIVNKHLEKLESKT
jgi:hypothetical protein